MKVTTDSCLFGAWAAAHIPDRPKVLDIGAGTGLLSLMFAQQHVAMIDAVEIEEKCVSELRRNFLLSPWGGRLRAVHADIREMDRSEKYGLILSNPPFHEGQLTSPDGSVNTARHSTGLTLRELLEIVVSMLGENGKFAILMPWYRKQELREMAATFNLFPQDIMDVRHSPEHSWHRTMMVFSETETTPGISQMDIRDGHGKYSQAFSELLAPYYLGI